MSASVNCKNPLQYFPLSFAQERLWLLQQIEPDCIAYHVPLGIRLIGPLNIPALENGLRELVRRHEVLRAVVREQDGAPYQVIHPPQDFHVKVEDVSVPSGRDKEEVLQRLATRETRAPFNLSEGPLFRTRLFRVGEREHLLLITAHHIVTDGWSRNIMLEELQNLYAAFSMGSKPEMAPLPLSYVDFAARQRKEFSESELRSSIDYWRERLRDAPHHLDLPTDYPRPSRQSYRGQSRSIVLGEDLAAGLKRIAQQNSATLFMALHGAFALLIARYTNSDDVVIGTPVAGRNRIEIERLVGFFVNMIALRTDLSDDPTFCELLQRVRDRSFEAYEHQEAPFEKVVNSVVKDRDLARSPLFQVVFQVKNYPQRKHQSTPLQFREYPIETETAQYDLAFDLSVKETGIRCRCEFATDLFAPSTIERMLGHYKKLVEEIVIEPNRPVRSLPILSEAERYRLLVQWNDTAVDYAQDKCVHELFEAQKKRTPDAVAAITENQQLSYRELDEYSNQIARSLRGLNVGPDQLVGVLLERDIRLPAVLLGILKSGAAYLPLDTGLPAERIAYMVNDADASIVITESHRLASVEELRDRAFVLDEQEARIGRESTEPISTAVTPNHLVYVIYTSGSTGQPKGVEVTHRCLVNFLEAMRQKPGLTASDAVLALTTLTFDIAGLEIWLPLVTGARVVLADSTVAKDAVRLVQLLKQQEVTVMQATPTTYRMLLEEKWAGHPSMKLLCGGEPLSPQLVAPLLARSGELWNMYGPTETTVWSTVERVVAESEPISIGRPIANTQLYILDDRRDPVPIGVAGELYIGGDGVSRGYRHRPKLTAERFLPNPWSDQSNARIYRTGDWARFLPDGRLECLGRMDDQIKVRGFRIEPGEIESRLIELEDVQQALVVLYEPHDGDQRLAAYYTVRDGRRPPDAGTLRRHLRASLPDYMVPQHFVHLERFPETPNGKTDRKALPRPQGDQTHAAGNRLSAAHRQNSSPSDVLEMQLRNTWESMLRIKPVGIHDDFFELGGHSLLAAKLMARIERIYGRRLPLATLLQTSTIAGLAEILRSENWRPRWDCLVPIRPGGQKPPLFLIHAAGGNILVYNDLAKHLDDRQPVYGLQSRGLDGRQSLHSSIEEMAAAYREEIQQLHPAGSYMVGGYCMGGTVALEIARQLHEDDEEVALVALLDCHNWSKLPPLSRLGRCYQQLQKLDFHWRNLWTLSFQEKRQFLSGKTSELGRRKEIWHDTIMLNTRRRGNKTPIHGSMAALWQNNEQVAARYVPKPYPGRITQFCPLKNYLRLSSGQAGWEDVAQGGVDIHTLQVYPAGMLMEPYVQQLADGLTQCIEQALDRRELGEPATDVGPKPMQGSYDRRR